MSVVDNGTSASLYYDRFAGELEERYESTTFEKVHRDIVDLVPVGGRVLDVGAGSGRDAAAIARKAKYVCAIEPSNQLRRRAAERHMESNICWVADSLPYLSNVCDEETFDLILLSSVWMHVSLDEECVARNRLSELLREDGSVVLTTRYPAPNIPGVIEKSKEHIKEVFEDGELVCVRQRWSEDEFQREGVDWLTLVFEKHRCGSRHVGAAMKGEE